MIAARSFLAAALAVGLIAAPATAQRGGPPVPPPASAQVGAPIDLTGQWVSVVTEDWRYRMVTAPPGDTNSVPLNPHGVAQAAAWNLEADNAAGQQCRAFGAGGLLRLPMRMRISWADGNTLRLETDRGQQVRLFNFLATGPSEQLPGLDDPLAASEAPSWQGHTRAQWFRQRQLRGLGFGGPPPQPVGMMRAFTQNLLPGYLRLNGVPYSGNAKVTENFNVIQHGDITWLVVTTIVEDPENLTMPFVTSTNFRKETGRAGWNPTPCHTDAPLQAVAVASGH